MIKPESQHLYLNLQILFSRAKLNTDHGTRQARNTTSNKNKKNASSKSSSRVVYNKRNSTSVRKRDVRKETISDDLEGDDDIDIDVGILIDTRLETTHRKPAVTISPNNPVMV